MRRVEKENRSPGRDREMVKDALRGVDESFRSWYCRGQKPPELGGFRRDVRSELFAYGICGFEFWGFFLFSLFSFLDSNPDITL